MSILNNSLLLGAPAGATGYAISRSLRFNAADSSFLSRTPASAGNRKTWTWAGWVKRSALGTYQYIWGNANSSAENGFMLRFENTDTIRIADWTNTAVWQKITTQVFRDVSAWYHIVISYDTTNATAADRVRFYVNGSRVTTFSTSTDPTQNYDGYTNNTSATSIGRWGAQADYYLNGYLADIHFIDGQALDPTSFGEFSATTGVWMPKAYTGTYGTNGFHLDFSNNASAAALGTDSSGLGNTWSVNNISVSNGLTSVAAATGALPVYNTTDTYGAVKGTGTRTDSNSSSIVLAVPMDGTNNGITFTDESATIKGSGSAKSITRNGDTKTSTTQSKFYGSSGYFDGSGDYLTAGTSSDYIFGTGDFTIECWAYFSTLNTDNALITNHNNDSNWVFKVVSGKLQYYPGDGNGSSINGTSTIGTGSWYHFSATRQSNTLRLFVNGVLETTATVSANYTVNNTLYIGAQQNNLAGTYLNGYLQDARIYKGVAKYTSNFNPPSSTQNPTLAAGNDSLVDVPTNGSETDTGAGGQVRGNYATLNPLTPVVAAVTLKNGNLQFTTSSNGLAYSTIGVTSGKWYFEYEQTVNLNFAVGVWGNGGSNMPNNSYPTYYWDIYTTSGTLALEKTSGSASGTLGSVALNDVIGVALDIDNTTLYFYRNGSLIQTITGMTISGPLYPVVTVASGTAAQKEGYINFGQRPFAYTAPSGFKALNTASLPSPLVTKPSTVMDVKLYTGNGSTQTISGLGFSPDFVWYKSRVSTVFNHGLFDIVRGAQYFLASNSANGELGSISGVTAFNSDGFTVGNDAGVNTNGAAMVAWAWDAGSSTVTNTAGSITSQVRANASAGFSIVTYTGSTGNYTFGHGLGAAPKLVLIKNRSASANWFVITDVTGSWTYGFLNSTDALAGPAAQSASSTVVNLANNAYNWFNANGDNYVAYCFAPVAGYSSFGSYVGNGSSSNDGPFVYTGFRPKWVMIKASSSDPSGGGWWNIIDATRNTYNAATSRLGANSSTAENNSYQWMDLLSNGFKLRELLDGSNVSGVTYIYAAFAESPFNYARAR
jgi:hypothetical protein